MTVLGVVQDEQKQPVEGAFVLLRLVSASSLVHRSGEVAQDVFAVTWTGNKGQFKFQEQPSPWFEPTHPLDWELCVFSPGHAIEIRKYRYLDGQARNERIDLRPECVIEGTVRTPDGKPVSNVEFAHVETVNPYENADLDYSLMGGSEMQCFLQPDTHGEIRIGGLPPQRIVAIISRPRHSVTRVATSADLDPKKMIAPGRPRSGLVYPYSHSPFEMIYAVGEDEPVRRKDFTSSVRPTRTATIRVVDAQTGAGVSEVAVGWDQPVDEIRIHPGIQVTDKDGKLSVEMPQDAVDVFVGGRRFGYVTTYQRITTDTSEFTPTVERSNWVKTISPGKEAIDITFELQPVPPLQITVQKEDGTPVIAELNISRHGWTGCQMPPFYSDERGQASVAIRPVMFEIEITALTKTGLKGSLVAELSKNFAESEKVLVVVK